MGLFVARRNGPPESAARVKRRIVRGTESHTGACMTVGEQVHLLDLSQNCQCHILQERPVSK